MISFFGGSDGQGQSGLTPQMQEQGGYDPYVDGVGYSQGATGPSQALQFPDYAHFSGQDSLIDAQGAQAWQQNVASSSNVPAAAVAALPPGAASAVVVGQHSPHPSLSSTGSPGSHASTAPLLSHGSPHRQQLSQVPLLVPYRGYAEPSDG